MAGEKGGINGTASSLVQSGRSDQLRYHEKSLTHNAHAHNMLFKS